MRKSIRVPAIALAVLCLVSLAVVWRFLASAPVVSVHGRWIRTYPLLMPIGDDRDENSGTYPIGAEILSAPMPNARLLEFRGDGKLYALIRDRQSKKIFVVDKMNYAVTPEGMLRIDGTCWKGWERYACGTTYSMAVTAVSLNVASWAYRRVDSTDVSEAGVAEDMPSPVPSATPPK